MTDNELEKAKEIVVNRMAELMEFWGFKKNMGKIWTILFLSSKPLTAKEISDQLGISLASVSLTIGNLERWGVIRKVYKKGDRNTYYKPETNIWRMITKVLKEREKSLLEKTREDFKFAIKLLKNKRDKDFQTNFVFKRIKILLKLTKS